MWWLSLHVQVEKSVVDIVWFISHLLIPGDWGSCTDNIGTIQEIAICHVIPPAKSQGYQSFRFNGVKLWTNVSYQFIEKLMIRNGCQCKMLDIFDEQNVQ